MPKETSGQNRMLPVPLADRLSVSPEQASALTGIGISRIREAILEVEVPVENRPESDGRNIL
jgi:hypothetical protein